jgi:DNA polymerase-3 subunit delta
MTAIKSADIDAFVARPDPARPIVLVFGPDAGLVAERSAAIVRASVDSLDDPFALARIDADDLTANPSRLVEEAHTIPLFGGRRAVWVKNASRFTAGAVETLLAAPAPECRVVIEAGELRKNAPLRTLCERAKNAAALPCYPDDAKALARLVDEEMRAAGLALDADARALLLPLLGGDRAASRSELRKLALYAGGRKRVGRDDVVAVVSDASDFGLDDVVDAAFAGRMTALESALAKARAAGVSPSSLLFAAQRQLAQLHKWCLGGAGRQADVKSLIPPVHFSRESAVADALKAWNAARLLRAMRDLADATLESRRNSALAATIAEHALLSIAEAARRKQ